VTPAALTVGLRTPLRNSTFPNWPPPFAHPIPTRPVFRLALAWIPGIVLRSRTINRVSRKRGSLTEFAANIPARRAVASAKPPIAPARLPPHNTEVEQALLGALLFNNQAFEAVGEFLEPAHFYDPVHGRIYGAIATLINGGQMADIRTLHYAFETDPALAVPAARVILLTSPQASSPSAMSRTMRGSSTTHFCAGS